MPRIVNSTLEGVTMQISIQSDIDKAVQRLQAVCAPGQLQFAVAKALTATAREVQAEVRAQMPRRFTLRRDWVVKGIMTRQATKRDLEAIVYSRDKFMNLQEYGGAKDPRGNYLAVPTSMVRRTPRDMIRKSDRPAQLGDRAEVVDVNGRKFLALKKARRGANGQRLRFLYMLIPRASIDQRLGLRTDGQRIARARFGPNLEAAIEYAMRTARRT
jgi:hypothetical protein